MPEELTYSLLATALRGGCSAMPPRSEWPALFALARAHGVLPLLADAAAAGRWDDAILHQMRPAVAAQTALSIVRERELQRVLAALFQDGIVALLLKGAHLAFTIYPSPDRRPHVDTDLLIKEEDRAVVHRCLIGLDYELSHQVTGDVAFRQCHYEWVDRSGAMHTIDVHWRIANPLAFAERLTFADLIAEAVPVPRLGPHASAPCPKHALLIACLHRTAHHGTSDRLLWLYDIHLLASVLTDRDWTALAEMAHDRGFAPVLAAGLEDTRETLATNVPAEVLRTLRERAGHTDRDVLEFLEGAPSKLRVAASDWRRLSGWRVRTRFLREHLFPSRTYMRQRYGVSSNAALPLLYLHRIVTGAWGWVRG